MAIKDMKGTVVKNQATMTGMMNESASNVPPPDMSKIKMPTERKQVAPQPVEQPVEQAAPQESGLAEKIQSLTNEDKATLSVVLSPSVSKVIAKLAPDVEPLLARFTKEEENIVLPVSIVKNFAVRKYGGDENQAVQSFASDLAGQMDQQPVPPDTQMAAQQQEQVPAEIASIDSGEMDTSISPQTMETQQV
jgi:hypothetical protein|tara:strand:+ start:20 stop:595 length:576 start_codon:yes stop_codon:yes gene_type:complete